MFTDDDRRIYSYQDGTRDTEGQLVTVYADPTEIDRAMSAALGGDVDDVIDLCREYDTNPDTGEVIFDPATGKPRRIQLPDVVHDNYTKLCAAIRKSFGLQLFDRMSGTGATAAMCIRLWNHYRSWVEKKEPEAASSPTSPAASPAPK